MSYQSLISSILTISRRFPAFCSVHFRTFQDLEAKVVPCTDAPKAWILQGAQLSAQKALQIPTVNESTRSWKKSQLPVPTCTCGTCVRCIFYLQIHTKTCHVISRLWHIMASRCLMHIFNNCLRRPYISSPKTATSCVFMLAAPLCHRLVQQSCCTCVQCVRFSWFR
jgi:hypothetical protein